MRQDIRIKQELKKYIELNELIEKLKKEKEKIKKYLSERIDNEIIVNYNDDYNIKALRKSVEKIYIDKNKLEKEYPEIYKKVANVKNIEYLDIRKIKNKDK